MGNMELKEYNGLQRLFKKCITKRYAEIDKHVVSKIYEDVKVDVERNTKMRNASTAIITVGIAVSKLEEKLTDFN
jgi:hypothetical protein